MSSCPKDPIKGTYAAVILNKMNSNNCALLIETLRLPIDSHVCLYEATWATILYEHKIGARTIASNTHNFAGLPNQGRRYRFYEPHQTWTNTKGEKGSCSVPHSFNINPSGQGKPPNARAPKRDTISKPRPILEMNVNSVWKQDTTFSSYC